MFNPPRSQPIARSRAARVLVIAASTRTGSLNAALARQITDRFRAEGEDADLVDLRDHLLPLYSEDIERATGVPDAAYELVERLAAAEVLVVVTPEYNGSFPPLLKNTVDWVSRVNQAALAHLTVLLASASPGGGGGANGLSMVRAWMSNMGVRVADDPMTIGAAHLKDDGAVAGVDDRALGQFVRQGISRRTAA